MFLKEQKVASDLVLRGFDVEFCSKHCAPNKNNQYAIVLTMHQKLILKLAVDSFLPVKPTCEYTRTEKLSLAQEAIAVIRRVEDIVIRDICVAHDINCITHLLESSGVHQLNSINEYYGSKIAIYFSWLSFYSNYLEVPAAAGTLLFLHQLYSGQVDSPMLPWFGILVSIWSTFLLKFWKRRNKELSFKWGVFDDSSTSASSSLVCGPVHLLS